MSETKYRFEVGGKKSPVAFSSMVIGRMFKDKKDLSNFLENYENAKVSQGGAWKEPTELQSKIAAFVKAGKNTRDTINSAIAKFKVDRNEVYTARNRVAVWEYINN
jgi:hypothetical protein